MRRAADALDRELARLPAVDQRRVREHFVVRSGPIPEGHERLAREAARGLAGISARHLAALIEGVRRPDTESLRHHLIASQQRRHALRASLCQPLSAALAEIRAQLAALHGRALAAGPTPAGFMLAGEALHLVQDSYSPAHVERVEGSGGRYPIVYIRYYGLTTVAPREHQFPFDPRDLVAGVLGGPLKRWARVAVDASREYLELFLRRLGTPGGAAPAAELRAYMDKHLYLNPHRTEPHQYHITCRGR